jgi:hypothetical protein
MGSITVVLGSLIPEQGSLDIEIGVRLVLVVVQVLEIAAVAGDHRLVV